MSVEKLSDEQIVEALATKVMGWKLCSYEGDMDYTPNDWTADKAQNNDGWYWDGRPNDEAWQWNPLTDPAASKQVREKLDEMGFTWSLANQLNATPIARFLFIAQRKREEFFGSGSTEERAVALCALRTVGVEV